MYKKQVLNNVLNSKEGLHLSVYLKSHHSLAHSKRQLQQELTLVKEELSLKSEKCNVENFMKPFNDFLDKFELHYEDGQALAIFRNDHFFTFIKIPVEVQTTFVISQSFHVLPILKWQQIHSDVLVVGLSHDGAWLYYGAGERLSFIDSYKTEGDSEFNSREYVRDIYFWLSEWITSFKKDYHFKLIFLSSTKAFDQVKRKLSKSLEVEHFEVDNALKDHILEYESKIREKVINGNKKNISKRLKKFYKLNDDEYLSQNVFQIADAINQGTVKKVIINNNVKISGEVDFKSGHILLKSENPSSEDLLDDLAQMVISKGGEVIVLDEKNKDFTYPLMAVLKK